MGAGGETATAAVRNAMRTVTARTPAWTRGGLMWPWAEESEGEREESAGAVGGDF
jgi:hypothetical protein